MSLDKDDENIPSSVHQFENVHTPPLNAVLERNPTDVDDE